MKAFTEEKRVKKRKGQELAPQQPQKPEVMGNTHRATQITYGRGQMFSVTSAELP